MRISKLAYAAVALAIALVVVVGLAKNRSKMADRNEVEKPRRVETTIAKEPPAKPKPASKASAESAAISAAAKRNRYVFVTFYRKDDEASRKMQAALKPAQGKLSHRASFVSVDVDDPAQQELIARYGADRSPIPLTLVVAPNGAITAGYPNEIKKADFSGAFVSDVMANVVKALQDQKLAVVCVQNSRTRHNRESLTAARGLASSPELAGKASIIRINSAAADETKLLRQLQIDKNSPEAQVIVIAPPGKVAGKFSGAVSTKKMLAAVSKSCGSDGSCAPSG